MGIVSIVPPAAQASAALHRFALEADYNIHVTDRERLSNRRRFSGLPADLAGGAARSLLADIPLMVGSRNGRLLIECGSLLLAHTSAGVLVRCRSEGRAGFIRPF